MLTRKCEKMKKSIIEWNINQRSNTGRTDFIPEFVAEIIGNTADIVILTEFYKTSNWIAELGAKLAKYNVFVTSNPTNDVLIAIKKDLFVKNVYCWESSYDDNRPDYLEVEISIEDRNMIIIGTRILVDDYNYKIPSEVNKEMENRQKQNGTLIERLNELKKKRNLIIGAGDFNTGRRNNPNNYWSKNVLDNALGKDIKLYTPEGVSFQAYKGEYAGCPDHLFASEGIAVKLLPYCWDFVKKDEGIYKNDEFTKYIPNPYPDHARVIAEIDI